MGTILTLFVTFLHALVSLLPSFISARIQAAIFCASVGLNLTLNHPITVTPVTVTAGKVAAGVYAQRSLSGTPRAGRTIVLVHGVSSTAHEDPRMVDLARALAAAHPDNIVVSPYIAQLAEIRMQNDVVDAIRVIVDDIALNEVLCPSGVVSIVSPCISGGFSMVAASYLDTVDAMLLIGPHSSVKNTLVHATATKGSDDSRYGINSVLASFYHPANEPLSKMLAAYCFDDHKRNIGMPTNELEPLLQQYPEEAKEYTRLHNDGDFLVEKLNAMYDVHREVFDGMSPTLRLEQLNVNSVTLVHSKSDEIVPPNESVVLRDALSGRKDMSVACMITSVLNHGDQTPIGVKDIPEVLKLIGTFSNFFMPSVRLPKAAKQV